MMLALRCKQGWPSYRQLCRKQATQGRRKLFDQMRVERSAYIQTLPLLHVIDNVLRAYACLCLAAAVLITVRYRLDGSSLLLVRLGSAFLTIRLRSMRSC